MELYTVQKQHLWEMYNSDDKLKTLTEMYTAKNNYGRRILKKKQHLRKVYTAKQRLDKVEAPADRVL